MAAPAAAVGQVVAPGDAVLALPESGAVRLGAGLRTQGGCVVAHKCGVVRQLRSGKLWLEGRQRRYLPAEEDVVVGIVTDRRGENFVVDVGAPFPAQLPMLSFDGATRRNRPNLVAGDLVYARVVAANRDTDPQLSCMDATGRAAGFGSLKGGLAIDASLAYCRLLLTPQRSQQQGQGQQQSLLGVLGSACAFELAVGLNGRVWVHAADVATTVRVCRVLSGAQAVPAASQGAWAREQLRQLQT